MNSIPEIGRLIFQMIIDAGYFIIGISALRSILANASKHDVEGIIKTILSTVIEYGSLFLVSKVLDMVKEAMA
jgi:uncharacterized membrane protein